MKSGKKKIVVIAVSTGVLALAIAAGGIWYGMKVFRNAGENENTAQADGTGSGRGDGFGKDGSGEAMDFADLDLGSAFSAEGTTQISTDSQMPDFLVSGINMTVEEVYVESGDTVAEGDALYKLTEESMTELKDYYTDAIKDATEELAQIQLEYDSGMLEAEHELQTATAAGETAQSSYDAALAELEYGVEEKQENYETTIETIQAAQAKIDDGTYEKEAGIEEKQAAVDSAAKTSEEAAQALNTAQSEYDAAGSAMAATMAELKKQTEAQADNATLLALTNQVVADYEKVQTASNALTEAKEAAAKTQGDLEKAQMTLANAQESCQRQQEEAEKKIEELTNSLESMREEIEVAEREAVTKKVELKQEYENAVLEGQYAQETYQATVTELETSLSDAKETLEKLSEEQETVLAMEDGIVRAAQAGVLAAVNYDAEDILWENLPFVTYYNTDTILISVEVPQENIADVAVGDETMVTIDGAMGSVTGTVASIATSKTAGGSISNVTYAVIISIDNTDGALSSGSSAVVLFGMGDFANMREMNGKGMPGNLPGGEALPNEEADQNEAADAKESTGLKEENSSAGEKPSSGANNPAGEEIQEEESASDSGEDPKDENSADKEN